jgi:hypothetical protein
MRIIQVIIIVLVSWLVAKFHGETCSAQRQEAHRTYNQLSINTQRIFYRIQTPAQPNSGYPPQTLHNVLSRGRASSQSME